MSSPRTAHPYRDVDVIDSRAPRFNQTVVGLGSLVAVLTGWWPILAALALQLGVGLQFGRRYCLPCVAYFELIQPRFGEGPIEDSRPPRFANQIGFVVLTAASVVYSVGLTPVGAALGGIVAALALLAASTGLCVGCELYRLGARVRGIRGRVLDRVELADLGLGGEPAAPEFVLAFSHPLCTDCKALEAEVRASGRPLVTVNVAEQRHLARKYGITLVPTAVTVAADGRVLSRLAG
ncbi:MAG TPA: DUF4395 family protein [Candidatus Binatia bacterium]|nr:DUF4395 family protein [Candidatus Binatia bacterium]